jgi:hypothetical protein
MSRRKEIQAISLTNAEAAFVASLNEDQKIQWDLIQGCRDELVAMANDPEPDHVADRWVEEDAISQRHDGYLSFLRNERS